MNESVLILTKGWSDKATLVRLGGELNGKFHGAYQVSCGSPDVMEWNGKTAMDSAKAYLRAVQARVICGEAIEEPDEVTAPA